jgi:hypothetical protein
MNKGTQWGALCQRDIDYCWATLLISRAKEKVSGPLESDVGLACHLYYYCDCCVGVANRCGQGVRVDAKIDAQRHPADVRTMDIGRVL